MALGGVMFVGCVVFFYSGTFMDMPGLRGLYQAFAAWAETAKAGAGHEKPWYYWLKLLGRYEWPASVGVVVSLLCVLPRTPRFIRAIGIYGAGALVAYSIINYKTPWCVVSLTWPFLLLFGYGADLAVQKYGPPVAVVAATTLLANLCDMVALNFYHFTDASEPYVYVQTFPEIKYLMKPLDEMVKRDAANYQMTGHIMMESYHPLPWLLGDYPNVGYWDDQTSPTTMDADFLMVDESRIDDVESKLHDAYFTWTFRLRDAEDPAKLYLNAKTFQSVFRGRKPDFVPATEAAGNDEAKPDASPGGETSP
jgi:predicted membrane-bound mannosyltransferase